MNNYLVLTEKLTWAILKTRITDLERGEGQLTADSARGRVLAACFVTTGSESYFLL